MNKIVECLYKENKIDSKKSPKDSNDILQSLKKDYEDIINESIKYIYILDGIFQKAKKYTLKYPLFRGIESENEIKDNKIGSIITFKELLSTSFSPYIAWKFQRCGKTPCCMFILRITNPLPHIPIYTYLQDNNMTFYNEHEILLPRNTTWKVIKKYKTNIDINQGLECLYKDIKNSKKIRYLSMNQKICHMKKLANQ